MGFVQIAIVSLFCSLFTLVTALAPTATRKEIDFAGPSRTLTKRTDPTFPASPPSCQICAQSYPSISSCAAAAPVLANFSSIIQNPGPFIDVIECSCTDTFKSAFPQCVDCFQQTNQTDVITSEAADLPSVLQGIRQICALASIILGNVTSSDGEQVNSSVPPSSTVSPSLSSTGLPSSAVIISPSLSLTLAVNLSMALILGLVGSTVLM